MFCPVCGSPQKDDGPMVCTICNSSMIVSGGVTAMGTGKTLGGRYEVIRRLDRGGMGAIYLVRDNHLDREFVVKELLESRGDGSEGEQHRRWFEREAKILCALRHPNIPVVIDFFTQDNRHCIVMDYIRGRNLEQEAMPMPPDVVFDFALIALDTLSFLHNSNIIHRDIKTEHFIREDSTGRIVLVDFGAARPLEKGQVQTAIGTQGFASPEHYEGKADPRSDIYSLGATLHHLLTGQDPRNRPPFVFEPVTSLVPDTPRNLALSVDRALKYNPDERFQRAEDMKDYLMESARIEEMAVGRSTGRLPEPPQENTSILPPEPDYDDYNVLARKKASRSTTISLGRDRRRGSLLRQFRVYDGGWIVRLGFLYPGDVLASALSDGQIILWDVESGEKVGVFKISVALSSPRCADIACSPDGGLIAQALENRQVVIWDVHKFRKLSSILVHRGPVTRVRFITGTLLASGAEDETVVIWDVSKGHQAHRLWGHDSAITSIDGLEDGRFVVAGTRGGSVRLWDLTRVESSMTNPVTEKAHPSGVSDSSSGGGLYLVTGGSDGRIRRWSVRRDVISSLSCTFSNIGHNGPVNAICVPGNGEVFVTGGADREVRIWEASSNRTVMSLLEMDSPVVSLASSPGGRLLAAAEEKGSIYIWSL